MKTNVEARSVAYFTQVRKCDWPYDIFEFHFVIGIFLSPLYCKILAMEANEAFGDL